MTLFPISPESQAYVDGYRSGQADRRLNIRNSYSAFVESTPGYPRNYSLGYRDGLSDSWMGKQTMERLGGN